MPSVYFEPIERTRPELESAAAHEAKLIRINHRWRARRRSHRKLRRMLSLVRKFSYRGARRYVA